MSDTPETDASSYDDPTPGYEVVLASFARKLERQRNELLEVAEKFIDAWDNDYWLPDTYADEVRAAIAKAKGGAQ